MGALDIANLVKAFPTAGGNDRLIAVDDLDLTVEDGEFLVMLGPSGCGKSTTLRCIAGLETPTNGTISLDRTDITDQSPQDRDMAMVFQDFALYPHLTAEGNMSFGLKMTADLSSDEIGRKVEEAAEIMDIGDLLDKKPGQLSGGQKQRVALGRAIVRDPEVFLMDEPLSNLDAKLRSQMRTEIQRLHQKLSVTTIYVTHDQTEAMTMGDRVAILNNGELQQVGTPNYVYHHPVNQFVAGFIGSPSMNFLEVELVHQDGEYRLIADGRSRFDYLLTADIVEQCDLAAGDSITAGVRPEDIYVPDNDSEQAQRAPLDVVEPMGSDNYLYLLSGNTTWTARVDSSVEPTTGEPVRYTFDVDALHLFSEDGTTLLSAGIDDDAFHVEPRRTAPNQAVEEAPS